MFKIIDVAIVVDTVRIAETSPAGSPDEPAKIVHDSNEAEKQMIFMVVNSCHLQDETTQATASLDIKGSLGDIIRWRVQSLSGQSSDAAVIYDIKLHSQQPSTTARVREKPELNVRAIDAPIPTQDEPLDYSGEKQSNPIWHYFIRYTDATHYEIRFYILRYSRGAFTTVGYYCWDSCITVSPAKPDPVFFPEKPTE